MNLISKDPNRPKCKDCNKNYSEKTGKPKKDGTRYYARRCRGCRHERSYGVRHPFHTHKKYSRPYLIHRKSSCEDCGFVPKVLCQLEVDHIDGNHKNNSIENLKTLCANCHRYKTWINRDHGRRVD